MADAALTPGHFMVGQSKSDVTVGLAVADASVSKNLSNLLKQLLHNEIILLSFD